MSPEENIALFRRAVDEVWNSGSLDNVGDLFTSDVIVHHPIQKEPFHGLEGFKQFPRMLREGFPDVNVTIERVISEGNSIGARWVIRGTHDGTFPLLPLPPTGRKITLPVNEILHVRDGKLAELWLELNILSVAQQLGVLPALDKAPAPLMWVLSRLQRLPAPPKPIAIAVGATLAVVMAPRLFGRRRPSGRT